MYAWFRINLRFQWGIVQGIYFDRGWRYQGVVLLQTGLAAYFLKKKLPEYWVGKFISLLQIVLICYQSNFKTQLTNLQSKHLASLFATTRSDKSKQSKAQKGHC